MPSPFPGMDPYLEGYLWPDVHDALAHKIRQVLAPQIQPNYVARLNISMVEDETFDAEIGVMYPDVEIVRASKPPVPDPTSSVLVAPPAPLTITLPEVRLVSVEIRDVAENQLVTSIEILSPINKRQPNLSRYRQKRERFRQAEVHLLEIDLLRRGTRVWEYSRIPPTSYIISLTRAGAHEMGIWPIELADALPILPVPLRKPDDDAVVNLQAIFASIYDEAYYQLSVDYDQEPPPPTFTVDEQNWIEQILKQER